MKKTKYCPFCGTYNSIIKSGRTGKNVQRYKCNSCRKTFINDNSTTSHLQNSDRLFKKFIGLMVDDVSLAVIARNVDIDVKTALYYRCLVFKSIEDYQNEVILDGTILIDETFIPVTEKKLRGLSFNQLCIITMIDLKGYCIAKVGSRATAKPQVFIDLCAMNIGEVNQFVHDGGPNQKQFMKYFEVTMIDGKRSESEEYSTMLIDSMYSSLKRYLFKHAGFKLKNLQHYLNFFVYRFNHTPKSKYYDSRGLEEKREQIIDKLYKRVKRTRNKTTYKTFLSDPGITDILESVKK